MTGRATPESAVGRAPAAEDSAAMVRQHFARLLQEKLGIGAGEAEQIALKWRYGTGRELRSFGLETYAGIFGPEIGAILHGYRPGVTSTQPPRRRSGRAGNNVLVCGCIQPGREFFAPFLPSFLVCICCGFFGFFYIDADC